jgi:hypothetical protein
MSNPDLFAGAYCKPACGLSNIYSLATLGCGVDAM